VTVGEFAIVLCLKNLKCGVKIMIYIINLFFLFIQKTNPNETLVSGTKRYR